MLFGRVVILSAALLAASALPVSADRLECGLVGPHSVATCDYDTASCDIIFDVSADQDPDVWYDCLISTLVCDFYYRTDVETGSEGYVECRPIPGPIEPVPTSAFFGL